MNDQEQLEVWVDQTLYDSTLPEQYKNRLRMIARKVITESGLRGDISNAWRQTYPDYVNTGTIPDLYV